MIILDENILDGQRLLLEAWRLAARQIGVNLGRKGLKDEEIVVLLRQQRKPTFFTRDGGFYHPDVRHRSYCLVVTSVGQNEVAAFVRRFLRHPDFDTQAKRMGRVVRVSHAGLAVWRLRAQAEIHTVWSRPR
ncbi:MAG: hypothetical protein WD696_08720 [Bryobacteraceae bacterium]